MSTGHGRRRAFAVDAGFVSFGVPYQGMEHSIPGDPELEWWSSTPALIFR